MLLLGVPRWGFDGDIRGRGMAEIISIVAASRCGASSFGFTAAGR